MPKQEKPTHKKTTSFLQLMALLLFSLLPFYTAQGANALYPRLNLAPKGGYLLSETKQSNFLKDTAMVKRLNDLNALPDKDKEYILYALDGLIKSAKLQAL